MLLKILQNQEKNKHRNDFERGTNERHYWLMRRFILEGKSIKVAALIQ